MTSFDSQSLSLVAEHIQQLLRRMGFEEAQVHCRLDNVVPSDDEGSRTRLCIEVEAGDEGKLLIGAQGSHLLALQHVVRCVLRRQLSERVYISLDVNGYRVRRDRSLGVLAETMAKQAQRTGRTIVMRPMGASDRRIIHTTLAERGDIKTESMGDEPNRRVVVRPIFI